MKKVLYSLLASAIVAAFAFISITNNVLPPENAEANTVSSGVTTLPTVEVENVTVGEYYGEDGLYLKFVLRTDTGEIKWYHSGYTVQVPDNVSISNLSDASLMYVKLHYTSTTLDDVVKDLSDFVLNYSTIIKSAEFQSYLESLRCSELELESTLKASEFHIITPTVLCQDASSLFAELDSNLN